MDTQVLSSVIAVAGTISGALIGAFIQREGKKLERLERKVERYRDEIRARQAEEDVATEWLAELKIAVSPHAAKLALRQRTYDERGVRPCITPSELEPNQ
jgi:hypothetical protein